MFESRKSQDVTQINSKGRDWVCLVSHYKDVNGLVTLRILIDKYWLTCVMYSGSIYSVFK